MLIQKPKIKLNKKQYLSKCLNVGLDKRYFVPKTVNVFIYQLQRLKGGFYSGTKYDLFFPSRGLVNSLFSHCQNFQSNISKGLNCFFTSRYITEFITTAYTYKIPKKVDLTKRVTYSYPLIVFDLGTNNVITKLSDQVNVMQLGLILGNQTFRLVILTHLFLSVFVSLSCIIIPCIKALPTIIKSISFIFHLIYFSICVACEIL